jgi:hypothetical protein
MVLRKRAGNIMSVSIFFISRGAATPFNVVKASIALVAVDLNSRAERGELSKACARCDPLRIRKAADRRIGHTHCRIISGEIEHRGTNANMVEEAFRTT